MTIKVTVTNSDTREAAVIKVQTQYEDGTPSRSVHERELKGGESAELWVHSTQQLLVTEVRQ
jgi:hypothetical protein